MTNTALTQRLASFAVAVTLTLGMLLGIDGLATSDTSPAQLARVTSAAQA